MVRVYAYRAFLQDAELSLEGIRRATELGAEGVVLDLHTTKDGVPVISLKEEFGGRRVSEVDYATAVGLGVVELNSLLKGVGSEVLLQVKDSRALDVAARIIQETGAEERCYLVVEDILQARAIRSISRDVGVITIVRNPFPNLQVLIREGSGAIAVPAPLIKPRLARECVSRGLKLFAWLVNDISLAVRVLRYGVELLVTSKPTLKREIEQFMWG